MFHGSLYFVLLTDGWHNLGWKPWSMVLRVLTVNSLLWNKLIQTGLDNIAEKLPHLINIIITDQGALAKQLLISYQLHLQNDRTQRKTLGGHCTSISSSTIWKRWSLNPTACTLCNTETWEEHRTWSMGIAEVFVTLAGPSISWTKSKSLKYHNILWINRRFLN